MEQPSEYLQLERFVNDPREDLDVEYKGWLDLAQEHHKATLAKAAIALSNYGGGFIILGFKEKGQTLHPTPCPSEIPEITQDLVNSAIRKYSEPESHCRTVNTTSHTTGITHPVIRVQASDVPVMCKRTQESAKLARHKFYIRKPGPRSEEIHSAEEWLTLIDRCVRARRENLLDAIRSIVVGHTDVQDTQAPPLEALKEYCNDAYKRWEEVVSDLPDNSANRFPKGFYELGYALVDANPTEDLPELLNHLRSAQSVKLSGWSTFLHLDRKEWAPYAYEDSIEAWVGRPANGRFWDDPAHSDFWRASPDGKLYTIRGYIEDGELAQHRKSPPGTEFSSLFPITKIAEGLLFASRLAVEFRGVEQIAIQCRFSGLAGRSILLTEYPTRFTEIGPACRQSEVILTGQVSLRQIHDNLPEVIHSLLKPLYERFDFQQVSIGYVQRVLQILRRMG